MEYINLSDAGYRQYKLVQMKLTLEEKELFEQHLEDYSKNY